MRNSTPLLPVAIINRTVDKGLRVRALSGVNPLSPHVVAVKRFAAMHRRGVAIPSRRRRRIVIVVLAAP